MDFFGFTAGTPNIQRMKARRDVRGLIRALQHKDTLIRQNAIRVLAQLGDSQAVMPIAAALRDMEPAVSQDAARALGMIGDPQAVEPLIESLEDRDPRVHCETARSLGFLGHPRAIQPIAEAIRRWDEDFHQAAFEALSRLNANEAYQEQIVDALQELLLGEVPTVRQTAATMLEKMHWQPAEDAAGASYWIIQGKWDRCEAIGVPAVKPLLIAMRSADTELRQTAFRSLINIGAPAAESLVDSIDEHDKELQQSIFWALVKIGKPALEPLIAGLQHERPVVRATCARALGQIGDQRAAKVLFASIEDGHPAVREAAIGGLAKLGQYGVHALVACLRNANDHVRWFAAHTLEQMGWQPGRNETGASFFVVMKQWKQCVSMGKQAVEPLAAALEHQDEDMRKGAAWALGKIGADSVPRLIVALRSDNEQTRVVAANALGHIRDERVIAPLTEALDDNSGDVRFAAISALARLHAPGEVLMAALESEDAMVRKTAVWALGQSRSTRAVEMLITMLEDEAADVRVAVIEALGKIGDLRALEPLSALKDDSLPAMQDAVAEALDRIRHVQGKESAAQNVVAEALDRMRL